MGGSSRSCRQIGRINESSGVGGRPAGARWLSFSISYRRNCLQLRILGQLQQLGWNAVNQGPGVPTDPAQCFRTSFREVALRDIFKRAPAVALLTEQFPERRILMSTEIGG